MQVLHEATPTVHSGAVVVVVGTWVVEPAMVAETVAVSRQARLKLPTP